MKVFLLSCSLASAAETLYVVDGYTVDVAGVRYRLHGIDAPEAGRNAEMLAVQIGPVGRPR